MSRRQIRAIVLSSVLAFSMAAVPLSAAPRERDRGRDRETPGIERVVQFVKRLVGTLGDTMSVPKP